MAAFADQRYVGGESLAEISRRIVQLYASRAGKGPTEAKTYWAGDDALLVLLGGGFTRGEQTLRSRGLSAEVDDYRRAMQEALEADMTQAVEEVVGRRVVAFMSATHHDPDFNAELFVLESANGDLAA